MPKKTCSECIYCTTWFLLNIPWLYLRVLQAAISTTRMCLWIEPELLPARFKENPGIRIMQPTVLRLSMEKLWSLSRLVGDYQRTCLGCIRLSALHKAPLKLHYINLPHAQNQSFPKGLKPDGTNAGVSWPQQTQEKPTKPVKADAGLWQSPALVDLVPWTALGGFASRRTSWIWS